MAESIAFDALIKLYHSGGHNAHYEHRGGRGIGCFEISFDEDGTAVDDNEFKEDIYCHNEKVKATEKQDAAVYRKEVFPTNPLNKTENGKSKCHCDGDQSEPVGNRVKRHIHANEVADKAVQSGKPHRRVARTDCRYVNESEEDGPYDKSEEKSCRQQKIGFAFFFHFGIFPLFVFV